MAVPLLQAPADDESADAVAGLIEELRGARGRPESALRRAVPFAAAIAPVVIDLVDRAANGVYLTPRQSNLLFWGVHVLAAGRRSELCAPLLRLTRIPDWARLDALFGDATTETLKGVFISIFDGNADALIEAVADQGVETYARWALFGALTRLAFDGAISREQVLDFLDRFERERLAPQSDPAWEGWLQAVVFLRAERLHDRLRQAWSDELFDDTISTLQFWEQQIAVVGAMRPDDAGLLDREGITAITGLNEELGWVRTEDDLAKRDARNRDGDPAAHLLPAHERMWLRNFLSSDHVPATSMTVEQLDGYFSALAICPSDAEPSQYMPAHWHSDAGNAAGPTYDNDEQAQYVADLLRRYEEAVERRIAAGFPHPPRPVAADNEEQQDWVSGFIRGAALQADAWKSRAEIDKDCAAVMRVACLMVAGASAGEKERLPLRESTRFFRVLPRLLLNAYRGWRGLVPMEPSPVALAQEIPEQRTYGALPVRVGPKIGRNQPCPCGSGKKFKRCCGGVAAGA